MAQLFSLGGYAIAAQRTNHNNERNKMNNTTTNQQTTSQVEPPRAGSVSKFYPTFFLGVFLGVLGAHRFYVRKIGTGLLQLVTFGGLGIWWLVDMIMILLGKFKDKSGAVIPNVNPKLSWSVFAIVVIIGIASHSAESGSSSSSGSPSSSSATAVADPTGTWVEGDQQSVYNRLVIHSSGTFSFETVDFTGDVKGGYSGQWSGSGRSLSFKWGGMADGGSCSGSINGPNSLTFGATTFHR